MSFARHLACAPESMIYEDTGARCVECGLAWPLSRDRHGKPREYRQPRKAQP